MDFIRSPGVYTLYLTIGVIFLGLIILFITLTALKARLNRFMAIGKLNFYNCGSMAFTDVFNLGYMPELLKKLLGQYNKLSPGEKTEFKNLKIYRNSLKCIYMTKFSRSDPALADFEKEYIRNELLFAAQNDIECYEITGNSPYSVMNDEAYISKLMQYIEKPYYILQCYHEQMHSTQLYEHILKKFTDKPPDLEILYFLTDYEVKFCGCKKHLCTVFGALTDAVLTDEPYRQKRAIEKGIELSENSVLDGHDMAKIGFNKLLYSYKNSECIYRYIKTGKVLRDSLYTKDAVFLGIETVTAFVYESSLFFTQYERKALYLKGNVCREVYFSQADAFADVPEMDEYPNICLFVSKKQLTDDPMTVSSIIDRLILYYKKKYAAGDGTTAQTFKIIIEGVNKDGIPEIGVAENLRLKLNSCFKKVLCIGFGEFVNEYKN